MTAKCKSCRKRWNVSVKLQIPKVGYICPRCAANSRSKFRGYRRNG